MHSGTLWRHQKQAMGMKKWVKNSASLSMATQFQPATLTLIDKDKKAQCIKVSNTCRIEAMQAQYKNRDHAFEIVCVEEKQHFLAAETSEDLNKWLIRLHDAAGLRKDHLFGDSGAGCGGGGGGVCVSGSGGGGGAGGGGGGPPSFENFGHPSIDGENELQDNLLYDSYDNKTFPVSIRSNAFTDSLNLHGTYTLQLDSMKISLIDINTAKILFSWPYRYLRRYGREKNSFSMEVGRRCLSGEGLIRFIVEDGNQVFSAIQSYVSAMTGRTGGATPTSAPQAPPTFNANLSPVSETSQKPVPSKPSRPSAGIKVLPAPLPRGRTNSAGARNNPPKSANHPQLTSRGAQSVDDITSGVSTRHNPPDQFYSAVSDEALDRSKLPSPKAQRAQKTDFEPEMHYDIASDPPPKQWPQVSRRDKSAKSKNLAPKPKPNPRTPSATYANVDKSGRKGENVLNDAAPSSTDKSGGGDDPGVYSCLEQPPGSVIGTSGGDGFQVHAETDDSDHIYDHLARGKVNDVVPTPRLPPSSTKQGVSVGGKGHPMEGSDMIYDHLDRGHASTSAPSNNGAAGVALEDAYDTLSLDSAQPSPLPGDATSYLASSYPSSTVPEESEYAEANANKYYYDENPYEVPEDQ
ncbi:uncharacterized protein [Diadema setosum]|uniref:uncharacterized protein n=1 Tax=Diadema setosum TaxID=31175 RepID=UPI003B3A2ACA